MWSQALSTHSIDLYVAIGAKDLLVEGSGLELLTGSATWIRIRGGKVREVMVSPSIILSLNRNLLFSF